MWNIFCIQILNKMVNNDGSLMQNVMENSDAPDFTVDDLTLLKEIFLSLEKVIDEVNLPNALAGETFTGGYIFSLLEKANVSRFSTFFASKQQTR